MDDTLDTPGRKTRQQQARDTRQRLIDTALALFSQQGYDATTIKDIAQKANVAQGLLYNYFPGKEDLFWAILDTYSFGTRLPAIFIGAEGRPLADVLYDMALTFHSYLAERKPLLQMIVREAQTNPKVADIFDRYIQEEGVAFRRFFETRIAAGELRPHDTMVTIRMLMSSVLILHLLMTSMHIDTHRYIREMVQTLLHGITV